MSQSTGSLVRMGTSTSVMLLDRSMLFQETWLLTYQSISKFEMRLLHCNISFLTQMYLLVLMYVLNVVSGMFYTSMRMKMLP